MNKRAFTLAEVLITLGIIGVVSALTLPSLFDDSDIKKSKTVFKKDLSLLNQAIALNKATYQYDFSNARANLETGGACGLPTCADETSDDLTFCGIFNTNLKNITFRGDAFNLKVNNKKTYRQTYSFSQYSVLFNTGSECYRAYSLPDNSLITFNSASPRRCTLERGETINADWLKSHWFCIGFIDTNGPALPNKEVSCSDGTETGAPDTPCTVKNSKEYITDIYPIVYHDAMVEPASNASIAILTN